MILLRRSASFKFTKTHLKKRQNQVKLSTAACHKKLCTASADMALFFSSMKLGNSRSSLRDVHLQARCASPDFRPCLQVAGSGSGVRGAGWRCAVFFSESPPR